MIIVKIVPGGVQTAFVEAESEFERQIDIAFWPIVRKYVRALDVDLQDFMTFMQDEGPKLGKTGTNPGQGRGNPHE